MKHSQLVKLYNYLATRPAPPKKENMGAHAFHAAGLGQPASVYCVCIMDICCTRHIGRRGKESRQKLKYCEKVECFPGHCGFICVLVSWADNAAFVVVVAAVSRLVGLPVLCAKPPGCDLICDRASFTSLPD